MFGRRKDTYEANADPDTLDDLSRKLAVDLRRHIRQLDAYPIFTKVREPTESCTAGFSCVSLPLLT
jgi:hypothetical protein